MYKTTLLNTTHIPRYTHKLAYTATKTSQKILEACIHVKVTIIAYLCESVMRVTNRICLVFDFDVVFSDLMFKTSLFPSALPFWFVCVCLCVKFCTVR